MRSQILHGRCWRVANFDVDCGSLGTSVSLLDVILDLISLEELPEAVHFNGALMAEKVRAILILGDEAVALHGVVPLDSACGSAAGAHPCGVRHRDLSLIHISEPTRLLSISYAVFCLKKKKKKTMRLSYVDIQL
eukprot:TRINITY_DN418_c0_g1_i11.p1 TRINITY_DN418_c0_g1~~TRINITY_DN418_c0_g1_i11.p1  ORF type:complete len:135 (-),score=19.07 TRINITY_DN418_c0_g1_i11:57-461(-)